MKKSLAMLVIFGIASVSGAAGQENAVPTRYGKLAVNREGVLLSEGRPIAPPIRANTRLDIGTPFRIRESDVVLVKDEGGSACPFQYYFVTLNHSGATHTAAFGTCNEVTSIRRAGDSITLRMHGYRGPFESKGDRERALRQVHTFKFRNGVVTETTKTQPHS